MSMELRSHEDSVQHWWRLAVERARAGDIEGAWRDQEAAERYGAGITNPQQRIFLVFGRLELLVRTGDLAAARVQLDRVRALTREAALPGGMGEEWVGAAEARLSLAAGRPDEAEPFAATAIRLTHRRGDMPDLAGSVELLALVRAAQGRPEVAVRVLAASAVIRGRLDLGSPELRDLRRRTARGAAGLRRAVRTGPRGVQRGHASPGCWPSWAEGDVSRSRAEGDFLASDARKVPFSSPWRGSPPCVARPQTRRR